MRKTALFFAPHPDDVEFGCSFYYMKLIEQDYRVIQISMTDGAFGTTNPDFKGPRLVRIREEELNRANRAYEIAFNAKADIVRLGYTDGHLPFTSTLRDRVIQIIQEYNPAIIFAPDPWYAIDYHPDHINTGRLVTFALKKIGPMLEKSIPLILYYSHRKNHYIKVKPNYLKILAGALSMHKSQVPPLVRKFVIRRFLPLVIRKNNLKFKSPVIGYRKQEYNYKNEPILPPKSENNLIADRIKYLLFRFPTIKDYRRLHDRSPEDVGMEIKQ